jgi:uncharacterized membrane protein
MPAKLRAVARALLSAGFIVAGANHFVQPDFYRSIMPPYLPWHAPLVALSGLAEVGLGALLLLSRFRPLASWGLVALLVAVFPANLQMALHSELYRPLPAWLLWLRLPLQAVLIWLVRWSARD